MELKMIVLGIDVGTTGTKTIAVDETGKCIGRGYREYELITAAGGVVEQDAEDWIRAIIETVKKAVEGLDKNDVKAISLSTQGATMTAVGSDFKPLLPCLTWMDNRSVKEAQFLDDTVGCSYVYHSTGWGTGASYDISKILWIKNNRPDIYARTYSFVSTIEYVNHFLTGKNVVDPTNAAIRGMYNINELGWDKKILEVCGVDESLLPLSLPTGAFVGNLTAESAELLGLSESVAVYNGAHDQYCAALGAGALKPGDMVLSTGTTWVVMGVTEKAVYTENRLAPGIHPQTGLYGAMASLATGGSALKWMKNLTQAESYGIIDEIAAERRTNCETLYYMPYNAGAGFPDRLSDIGGCCVGMALNHDKYDMALAVMEGCAFETKNAILGYKEAGIDIERLRMIGGASRSSIWPELVAYITGCEVTTMKEGEGCAMGAAMIAGVGCGMFESYAQAASTSLAGERVDADDEELKKYYADKFVRYNTLSKSIKSAVRSIR